MKQLLFLPIIFLFMLSCTNKGGFPSKSLFKDAIVKPLGFKYEDKEEFTILSWNVEHFVDPFDNPYIDNERENNPNSLMSPRISPFLSALRIANADVVVLQEFESSAYLRKLAADSLSNMGYRYFADAPSQTWYMNVVVMSKFPLGVLSSYGNVTTPVVDYLDTLGRTETQNRINTRMWSVDVFAGLDYNFLLTGLHLKAGRGERNVGMRKGQINFLKSQFDKVLIADTNRNILVTGDLNATPDSEEIKLLLSRGYANIGFKDPLSKEAMSHPADDAVRRLDYILPNDNMIGELENVEVKYFFDSNKMRSISDHLPLMAKFKLKNK